MAVERIEVAQNLARVFVLGGAEQARADHETDRAPGVHHVAPDAARHVLVARNRCQHLARLVVGHIAGQHLATDFFQVVVNALDRVGAVFGVGVKEAEQHVFGVFDQARHAARAQAQQAKHRHVFVVDGKQHATALEGVVLLVQDERHAHRARVRVVGD